MYNDYKKIKISKMEDNFMNKEIIKVTPKLTPEEIADAKAIIRLYNGYQRFLTRSEHGRLLLNSDDSMQGCMAINDNLFPSLKYNEMIDLKNYA